MKTEKTTKSGHKAFIYWSAAIIIIWGIYLFLIPYLVPEKTGEFGDMFGALSLIFSGLAFAGIIYSIYLQKKELGLQRQELEETRKELKRSADAQENSEKELKNQAQLMATAAKINGNVGLINHFHERRKKYTGTEKSRMDELSDVIAKSLGEDLKETINFLEELDKLSNKLS